MDEDIVTTSARRFRARRRRFLLVGVAALAAVAAALGISFTADTGTADVTVSPGTSSPLVFPIADGATLPPEIVKLQWTLAAAITPSTDGTTDPSDVVTATLPRWAPVAGAAGTIVTPATSTPGTSNYRGGGDLFVVDGRTNSAGGAGHIVLNVYITNLAALQASYSSYSWPLRVYWADSAGTGGVGSHPTVGGTGGGTWALATGTTAVPDAGGLTFTSTDFYLTNTGGYLSYYLPTGAARYYLVTLDAGGSYYTVNTSGTLNPSFFATAQAT